MTTLTIAIDEVIVCKAVDVLDQTHRPDIVVLARDLDRASNRLSSLLEGARKARSNGTVVIAAMQPEAKAWRSCAFQPVTGAERKRHGAIRGSLSFDPVREPEKLSSASITVRTRDAKRVHGELFGGDIDRSQASLQRSTVELRSLAPESGLPAFIGHFAAAVASAQLGSAAE